MAILLDGVAFGLQLSLLAVGLTLVYGLGGILNLAHGQVAVVAGLVGAGLLGSGASVGLAVPAAVGAAVVTTGVLDAVVLRRVYRLRGEPRVLSGLLVTLGVAFLLDGLVIATWPFTALTLPAPGPAIEVLGVQVRSGSLLASGIALAALVAAMAFLRLTRFGTAIRAAIQDEEGALLCGVDVAAMRRVVFALSGVMAGLFAVTEGLRSSVGATSGMSFTILALIVAVVGGLGRVAGALVAGLLLGIVHAVASFYIGTFITFVLLLVVAMVAILLRPRGLLHGAA